MDSNTFISRAVVRNRGSGARDRATTELVFASLGRHATQIVLLLGLARVRLSLRLTINVLEVWTVVNQAADVISTVFGQWRWR